jgi:hypothetical protein
MKQITITKTKYLTMILSIFVLFCYALFVKVSLPSQKPHTSHNITCPKVVACPSYGHTSTEFADIMTLKSKVQISIPAQKLVYKNNYQEFDNLADFNQMPRILPYIDPIPSAVFLIGGIDRAQMTLVVASLISKDITIHGFEILKSSQQASSALVAHYPNVHIHHLAWGEASGMLPEAATVSMAEWADENHVTLSLYTLIDVEGHEPRVLRGMKLHDLSNQRRFPIVQYELGGTWAERDKRHFSGNETEWTQKQAAEHMRSNGYELFIIGTNNWMRVDPEFFEEGDHSLDEGRGRFVQGNLLCLHLHFCPSRIMRHVLQSVAKTYLA